MKKLLHTDYILIILFCSFICIPNIGLFISSNNKFIVNNLHRRQYKFPRFFKNINYFSEVEDWYVDKIIIIQDLSKLWSNINYKMNISTKPGQTIIGKDGWLFLGNDYAETLNQYTGELPVDTNKLFFTINSFRVMKAIATINNIPFVVVAAPDKHDIYSEYLPPWINKHPKLTTLDYLDSLLPANNINFIDLRDTELQAKKSLGVKYGDLYMKANTHWNYLGAYAAYNQISTFMRKLGFSYVGNHPFIFKPRTVNYGDLSRFLQIDNIISNAPIPLYNAKDFSITEISDGIKKSISPYDGIDNAITLREPVNLRNNALMNNRSILIIGDSFMNDGCGKSRNCLGFFFMQDFRNTIRIHPGYKGAYNLQDLIDKYHPSLILFEMVERSFIGYNNDFSSTAYKESINITPNSKMVYNVEKLTQNGRKIEISGWGYIADQNCFDNQVYLELSGSNKNNYYFVLSPILRMDVRNAYKNIQNSQLSGFEGNIDTSALPPGNYIVSLLIVSNKKSAIIHLIKSITIK